MRSSENKKLCHIPTISKVTHLPPVRDILLPGHRLQTGGTHRLFRRVSSERCGKYVG